MLKMLLAGLTILVVLALIAPRMMPDDPARWHVDPRTATLSEKPNNHRVAIDLPLSPTEALAAFDALAMAAPRVSRLVQDEAAGRVTYVQRSAVFGFPDYISVSVEGNGTGSTLTVYSRSRFGYSDLGVNKARIERWLGALRNKE